MKEIDVVAIGELLIDFTPTGMGEIGNPAFEMNSGGASANCLVALNALDAKTAFIGKVDYFARCKSVHASRHP